MNPLDPKQSTIAEQAQAGEVAAPRPLTSESLSDELLVKVFSFLDAPSLARVPIVSKAWRQIAYMSPTNYRLNESIQRIPALKWDSDIYGSSFREKYLNFWKAQHQRTNLIRAPFPLYPKGLADDMEREAIISFCRALPAEIRATLPSLENNGLSLEVRAENLLRELNNNTVRNVTYLGLSSKNLIGIPKGMLQHFKNLRTIDLNNNELKELPEDIFQGLAALETIYLGQNQLKELPAGIFQGLTALTCIYLINNQIKELPEGIFQGLTALKYIYLRNNQLKELPAGIFQGLTALTDICLNDNKLQTVSKEILEFVVHNKISLGLIGNPLMDSEEMLQDPLFLQFANEKGGSFLYQVNYNLAQSKKLKQQVIDWLVELEE